MDYINYIIIFIIYIDLLILLLLIIVTLWQKLIFKPSTISYYRINNIYYTVFCNILYICFFILFLYYLRIHNIGNFLDLNVFVKFLKTLTEILELSVIYNVILISLTILLITNTLLCFILIHKYFMYHIYVLYCFIKYNPLYKEKCDDFIFKYLSGISDSDFISYKLKRIIFFITEYLFYYNNNLSWKSNILSEEYKESSELYHNYLKSRSYYHPTNLILKIIYNKYYRRYLIPMSPIFIVIYDCIFNNLIISHVYYYLLLYIPLMLFRRITILTTTQNYYIGELIWNILYKEEKNCIYALPPNHKKLFDIYIMNGIKSINTLNVDLDVCYYIKESSRFIYNPQEKCYQNSDSVEIYESINNVMGPIKVIQWVDQEEIYEEWIIIAIKHEDK